MQLELLAMCYGPSVQKGERRTTFDGLLDSLTQAEAIHLLRFITEMGKIDGHVPTSPWCA
jgi:hypothetical protein